ncbi:Myb family transcription factor [Thalictrum thalictroides]|uniref:Myb family transcription factor n=1 Tax=Thalictrum thalictroides TaxID=46969 RepID=A0A7J6UX69_THATH|nr:Myb family transcription factor [Thalictrum thalictroides]
MTNIFVEEDMSLLPENNSFAMENKFLPEVVSRSKRFMTKGHWSAEEDKSLVRLVHKYGMKSWSDIADRLGGRIGKQCRERWYNHLCPDIKKQAWSEEEDKALIEAHKMYGNSWTEIAKRIPGRPENSIKNRWNIYRRKYLLGDSNQPQSILLDYISLCDRIGILNRNVKGKAKSESKYRFDCNLAEQSKHKEMNESQEVYKPYIPFAVNEDTHGEQLNFARDSNLPQVEDMELSALLSGLENPNIDSDMAFGNGNNGLDFVKMAFPSVNLGAWYGY